MEHELQNPGRRLQSLRATEVHDYAAVQKHIHGAKNQSSSTVLPFRRKRPNYSIIWVQKLGVDRTPKRTDIC